MNIVCMAGNVTKEIELRSTQSGKQVASFSIAINEGKDKTEFVNCVAWEKTAELLSQYVNKGDRLSFTGRYQTRSWEDKEGQKRYATEIVVNQFDIPPKGKASNEAEYTGNDLDADEIPF